MKPFYKETIQESWRLATSKRYLWPLGLLASLLGLSTTFRIIFDLQGTDGSAAEVLSSLVSNNFMIDTFVGWSQAFSRIPWAELEITDIPLLGLIMLLFAIIILLVIVTVSAQAGLFKALEQTYLGKKTDFFLSFGLGVSYFWEVFIFNFFYAVLYLFFAAGIIVPLIQLAATGVVVTKFWLSIITFFILIPALIVLDIVVRYAILNAVLLKKDLFKAWDQAWVFFKQNWLISIETSVFILLLLMMYAVAVQYILLPLIIIILGYFSGLLPEGAAQTFSFNVMQVIIYAVIASSFILFTIFYHAVWTKIFLRLQSEPHLSKVERSTKHFSWLHRNLF